MNAKGILIMLVVLIIVYFILRAIMSRRQTTSVESAKTSQTIDAGSLSTDSDNTANFTYSIWMYVDDWNYRYGEPKIVLGRMASGSDPQFGIILGAMQNNLNISIETYPAGTTNTTDPKTMHTCNIQNIPLQKWVHCLVSVYGKSMDVYIDGKLVKTSILPGVAKVNNSENVYITPMGGFSGYTSRFQYWATATNPQEAYNIYKKGFGGSSLGSLFNKYRLKFTLLVDNQPEGSFEV